ncbi:hypothetical protein AX17_003901 [Amanita inopinata Kibby_2008]|nr:hypothetical protein AX17_003901 [Amanita inopinata Kibby_2008]
MASEETGERHRSYSLLQTLKVPSSVSSIAFGHAGHLFVGSHDGILRVYDLSTFKVIKGVRKLGSEVSSIVCVKRPGSDLRDAWIACGTKIMQFQFDTPKMILTVEDALAVIDVCTTRDDTLNEIALNTNKSHIAFSADSGTVGIIDLSTKVVFRMKHEHKNVCGTVKFIPNKPSELVSGGYDQNLLHFDYGSGTLITQHEIAPSAPEGGMSLSPPFIASMAVSSTGVLSAGTADGRLWISFAGESPKDKSAKSKKSAKHWKGLERDKEHLIKIAEGPVVAMALHDPRVLTVSSLMGIIMQYHLVLKDDQLVMEKLWKQEATNLRKVNALIADERRIIVGGLQSDGSGVVEIWKRERTSQEPPGLLVDEAKS